MSSPGSSAQRFEFDFAPAVKMYMDSMEGWKETYENALRHSPMPAAIRMQDMMAQPCEQAMANWQKGAETLFKSMVAQQIEFCRFLQRRLEHYRDMPQQLARCKTPADLCQLEFEFFSTMVSEYVQEGTKLMEPMGEFAAACISGDAAGKPGR